MPHTTPTVPASIEFQMATGSVWNANMRVPTRELLPHQEYPLQEDLDPEQPLQYDEPAIEQEQTTGKVLGVC